MGQKRCRITREKLPSDFPRDDSDGNKSIRTVSTMDRTTVVAMQTVDRTADYEDIGA